MKKNNKLFSLLTISTFLSVPFIHTTSCAKRQILTLTFTISGKETISSKQASLKLNWTPSENNLIFSDFTFKYNTSKLANVTFHKIVSGSLLLKLAFDEDIESDIVDGKLNFHCKDITTNSEFNETINDITIKKYSPPPFAHEIKNPITEFKTYCPASKKSVEEWTNSPIMTLDDGVDANWSFTPINDGWVSLLNTEEEPNFIFIKDSSVVNGMKLKFNAISEMDERKTASLNSMFSAAGSNTISQDVNIEAVSKNDVSVKANFTFTAKLSIKFMYKIKDVPDDSDISPIQIDGNGDMIGGYTLGTSAGDSLMHLDDDKGDIINIKDQTWEKTVACDYSNFDPTKAQIIVRDDNKFMLYLQKGAVWSASTSNKATFTIKLSNLELGTFTATCQVGFDEY